MRRTAPVRAPRSQAAAFALTAALLLAGPLRAQADTPVDPLSRMHAAIRQLDFQGSFVYVRGGDVQTQRIFHAGGSPERERLLGLNGAPSEITREGSTITYVRGGAPSLLFRIQGARLLPLLPGLRGGALPNAYTTVAVGVDRVAGYQAHVVDVRPNDAYRYGYRLWLEDGSGFPLRSAVMDASHKTLEEYLFVSLDLGSRPREGDLAAAAGTGPTLMASPDEAPIAGAHWRVADLPPGFTLARTQRSAQDDDAAEHQVYTDGLASVSLYIEPRAKAGAADRALGRGMLNIFTHEAGDCRIAALGDVPRATLERMARSVKPIDSR